MKVMVYSLKDFERSFLDQANIFGFEVAYTERALSSSTAGMAKGFDAISIFPNDDAGADILDMLSAGGTRFIAIRAAGYDNVDLARASVLGLKVANVPAYSPYAIAEHAISLILALNRKLIRADQKVHKHDFSISDLVGFDLNGKTAGIIGTGKIGGVMARILHGFGCHLLGFDVREDQDLIEKYNLRYTDLTSLCFASDIISIHLCLNEQTKHLINKSILGYMKKHAILVNTSRGGIIDTKALVEVLEAGEIGAAGLDVYEYEKGLFFYDHSGNNINDPLLLKLLSFPNVLITAHQAFATKDALGNIAATTFENLHCWAGGKHLANELRDTQPTNTSV